MKISELVSELLALEGIAGDIPVRFVGTLSDDPDDDSIAIAGVTAVENEDGDPVVVLICDDLTLDEIA